MELSSRVTKEWVESYRVHEVRFLPDTGGFFSTPERFVLVVQKDGEENSEIKVIYCNCVDITYKDGVDLVLTLHKRIREGQKMDAFMSGPYKEEELVRAKFKLPTGYKVLGLEKKLIKSKSE